MIKGGHCKLLVTWDGLSWLAGTLRAHCRSYPQHLCTRGGSLWSIISTSMRMKYISGSCPFTSHNWPLSIA